MRIINLLFTHEKAEQRDFRTDLPIHLQSLRTGHRVGKVSMPQSYPKLCCAPVFVYDKLAKLR